MLASASLGMWPLVRILAPLIALVMLVPGFGAAAAQQDRPGTTPTDTAPPPEDPTPPGETVTTVVVPAKPHTITIVVPALPERAPKKAAERKRAATPPVRKNRARPAPTVSRVVAEPPSRSSPRIVVAAVPDQPAQPAKAAKTAKAAQAARAAKAAKARKQKASRPKRAAPPRVSRPAVIRVPDQMPGATRVLAAQFSAASVDPPTQASRTILYLALAFAALLSTLVALVAAAPSLVPLWPTGLCARHASAGTTPTRCGMRRLRRDHPGAHLGAHRPGRLRARSPRSTDAVNHLLGDRSTSPAWCMVSSADNELDGPPAVGPERSRRTRRGCCGGPVSFHFHLRRSRG